ncbi:MAG: transposase, partial [Verrucomicrobia bacterium]|nr:transposase [Verrucomicrobiota bacterium]MCF7708973.1 transposase [Verrucomicrobiota bacterium]
MYFRVKRTASYPYLQIVESFREGKSVKQRVLMTVGRLDVLQQSGKLDGLIRSGLRLCRELTVLDAHAYGKTNPVSVRSIGPDLVFGRLWEQTGIKSAIQELCAKRRFGFNIERAVYLTALHRLFAPSSDRACERWRQGYRIAGTQELQLHQ